MRPGWKNLLSTVVGMACAAVVLVGSGVTSPPGPPRVLISQGSTERVSQFHNASISGFQNYTCGPARCGSPGEIWFEFSLARHSRISGLLRAATPFEIWVGNALGMEATCGLSNPPPPCAPLAETGPSYLYQSAAAITNLDLGRLVFGFGGEGSLLPAGSWTILLINRSDIPVVVTAESDVVVTPMW